MTSETNVDGAQLPPREASPAKVAKDGQHSKDDDDDPQPGHAILSLGACRDSTASRPVFARVRGLRREWNGSRSSPPPSS
jgi:hypothetical protein